MAHQPGRALVPLWCRVRGRALTIGAMTALLLAAGTPAYAQVTAVNDGPLLAAARDAGARLAETSSASTQSLNRQPNWVVRHPVLAGTIIGSAGGAVLSRFEAVGGVGRDPRVMLIGAGAGAGAGLVASAVQKSRAGKKVSTGTKLGIAAGAVSLVVLPALACYGAGGCGAGS